MAIEVTFGVRGRATKQALFIQESDWELSLSEARKIIQGQDLYVPLEYKFLTLNGNAIAQPSEDNLLLKDVAHHLNQNEKDEGTADLEIKSEKDDEKEKDSVVDSLLPEIWVTPLKVTFSSCPASVSTDQAQAQGDETEPLLGDENNEENGTSNDQTSADGTSEQCGTCPFKTLTDVLRGHGCLSPKNFVKIIFCLTVLLFAVLASLTLTMHVMVRAFMSVSQSPAIGDLFTKMNMNGASSETLTNLQVKLSQLEVSSKYEIDRLGTRLAELEDLYLRDLAVHKRELSLLKRQIAEKEGKVVDEMNVDEMPASDETKQSSQRKNAEKRKKKENQRNKG